MPNPNELGLTPQPEQQPKSELQRWQEAFPVERIDSRVQFEVREVIKNRVAVYEGYMQIYDFAFNMSVSQTATSPRAELIHQIKNTIMRGNALLGKNLFDFSQYPQLQNEEQTAALSKTDLLDLYFQTTKTIYDPFQTHNPQGIPQDNVEKPVVWFGENLTARQLLFLGYGHEARHSGINVRDQDVRWLPRTPQDIANWGK